MRKELKQLKKDIQAVMDLLGKDGENWIQKNFKVKVLGEPCKYCLMGAIHEVLPEQPDEVYRVTKPFSKWWMRRNLLVQAIGEQCNVLSFYREEDGDKEYDSGLDWVRTNSDAIMTANDCERAEFFHIRYVLDEALAFVEETAYRFDDDAIEALGMMRGV